jgi:hypothetical protein
MFFSLLVMCGLCYAPLLCVCWILYLSILLVGQTFLSFQWDIFLLEVGGLAILYAPLSPLTAKRQPSAVIIMCLNWCLFKIMLMSGVVKVQARCPTWMKLTALHYHYATQCIPTPLSWYAHQLPNFIQKFSVMGTLLVEIPGAFLIIAPWREARVCAAYLNILLMLVILLTGNYTFFNVLTAALCLPLLEEPPAPWTSAATHLAAESSNHDTEHTTRKEDEEELVEEGIRNGLSKCKEILQRIPAAEEHEHSRQAAVSTKKKIFVSLRTLRIPLYLCPYSTIYASSGSRERATQPLVTPPLRGTLSTSACLGHAVILAQQQQLRIQEPAD